MKVELLPLLQIQRDLYDVSDRHERFQAYLKQMLSADASDVEFMPLVTMNPMGKAHVPAMLDSLLAINAEEEAARAIAAVSEHLKTDSCTVQADTVKLGLVVSDDLMGRWTNRYTSEFSARFELKPSLKRGWLTVTLWVSESPTVQKVREETLMTVYRAAYIQWYGFACTLEEMLNQEGYAMAMAGCQHPTLDVDDLAYTQEVIAPHLSTQDYPTLVSCLFGDRAAHSLGYPPQGLSNWAGLALALHRARQAEI